MSINSPLKTHRSERFRILENTVSRLLLVVAVLVSVDALAEGGQYRSKVILSPVGEMDKNAGLSIAELEQQINGIEQAYAKSSAGRHLARHYVEQGEYDKAIEYYQIALAAEGLSNIANREMLREVARVQLLQQDYAGAVKTLEAVLEIDLLPEAADFLLLSHSQYKLGKYVAVVAVLDRLQEQDLTLTIAQIQQSLALYYRTGAYAQCEGLLQQLLILEPQNPKNWHLLVSVYLQQSKKREALDRLALAREKAVPFSEQDVLLLVDLQATNENPYSAAEILSAALMAGEIEASGENYRKLFELWFLAREKSAAQEALARAAQLSSDTELYLYLAQLQMDEKSWPAMHKTMLEACKEQLNERYLSKANLLLGVSQLKMGDAVGARRSFINATLVGGATEQAGQWLNYMQGEPASKEELRRIVGVCYGERDKRAEVAVVSAELEAPAPAAKDTTRAGITVETKTVPAMRLYYIKSKLSLVEVAPDLTSIAARMSVSLARAQGTAEGPLHLISTRSDSGKKKLHIAFPVRGLPVVRGQYKTRRTQPFKCAYLTFKGSAAELKLAWRGFARAVVEQGHELSGEVRTRVNGSTREAGILNLELQLGIR